MSEATKMELTEQPQGREVAAVTPAQMLQIAVERGADLDKLEKLMQLQERWEANEARKSFVAALNAFKSSPPTISKNKHVTYGEGSKKTEYDHATLDNVVNVIAPALSSHGLTHRWSTDQGEGGIAVTCTLTHAQGHSESVTLRAPADQSGGKNNIQAIASTVTYLQRYTLLSITGLAVQGMDTDGAFESVITADQVHELSTIINSFPDPSEEIRRFCEWLGVGGLADIPAKDFENARGVLRKKLAKANREASDDRA